MDRLGSVVAMSDTSGEVLEQYRYSPYGVPGWEGPAGFPFRFTGQKLDPETGLYYYKARYYDPETGRFLQTDPIGYEDQMNLYAYVGSDPVNLIDPSGLCSGSRITNDDGTCASTGGFTTGLSGHAEGMQISREFEKALTAALTTTQQQSSSANSSTASGDNSGSGQTSSNSTIDTVSLASNRTFVRSVERAWRESNPYGPVPERREVGFYANASVNGNGKVTSVSVGRFRYGKRGENSIVMGRPDLRQGPSDRLVQFHTHPFPSPQYIRGPSPSDFSMFGNIGVVRNASGLCFFNKFKQTMGAC